MQVATNGNVGFDIHHNDMFAVPDCFERNQGSRIRIACRINEHFNASCGSQGRDIARNWQEAAFDRRVNVGWTFSLNNHVAAISVFDSNIDGIRNVSYGDGTQPDTRHPIKLHDQIGSHLADTDYTDRHRLSSRCPGLKRGDQGGNILDHVSIFPDIINRQYKFTISIVAP